MITTTGGRRITRRLPALIGLSTLLTACIFPGANAHHPRASISVRNQCLSAVTVMGRLVSDEPQWEFAHSERAGIGTGVRRSNDVIYPTELLTSRFNLYYEVVFEFDDGHAVTGRWKFDDVVARSVPPHQLNSDCATISEEPADET